MRKIKVTSLKDTIPYMTSGDYKERFKGEYYQLVLRIHNLENIIRNRGNDMQVPTLKLFMDQLDCMKAYKDILERRAAIQNIEL